MITNGSIKWLLTCFFPVLVCGFIAVDSVYAGDDSIPNEDIPPAIEQHPFKKYRIGSITPEDLSGMTLEHPRLKVAYEYFFESIPTQGFSDSIPNHGVSLPPWMEHIRNDMLRRGGAIQELLESIYREKRSLSIRVRLLGKLPRLPPVDKHRFIVIIREELDSLPRNMSMDNVFDERVIEKLGFILRWGNDNDVEYALDRMKDCKLEEDPWLHNQLKYRSQSEKRSISRKRAEKITRSAPRDAQNELSQNIEKETPATSEKPKYFLVWILAGLALFAMVILLFKGKPTS